MRQVTLRIPELMFVVGTRVMIGVGVGLLAAGKLRERPRKAIGMTLLLIGAVSTVPVIMTLRSRMHSGELSGQPSGKPDAVQTAASSVGTTPL